MQVGRERRKHMLTLWMTCPPNVNDATLAIIESNRVRRERERAHWNLRTK